MTTEFYGLEPGGLLPSTALKQLHTARMGVVGTGRPDVPTTTPYTATELNALPVGTEYRSTNGPQGAWRWLKTGMVNYWRCIEGDTGDRIMPLFNGWVGHVALRRTGNVVTLSIYPPEPTLRLSGTEATANEITTLPAGFRPRGSWENLGWLSSVVTSGTPLNCFINGNYAVSLAERINSITGSVSWCTDQQWPADLPGDAA